MNTKDAQTNQIKQHYYKVYKEKFMTKDDFWNTAVQQLEHGDIYVPVPIATSTAQKPIELDF